MLASTYSLVFFVIISDPYTYTMMESQCHSGLDSVLPSGLPGLVPLRYVNSMRLKCPTATKIVGCKMMLISRLSSILRRTTVRSRKSTTHPADFESGHLYSKIPSVFRIVFPTLPLQNLFSPALTRSIFNFVSWLYTGY
jgi:hypothetical protein